ncbi:MAG TPA: hypothetical protein VN680_02450 [Burkholderiaceae bacterium]|nr:hypothetical protein [Burkholderiaceae bacterium]
MTPELEGFAAAVAQIVDDAVTTLRQEHAQALEGVRRAHDQVVAGLSQRIERGDARAEQLQRDLDAARQLADEPGLRTALMDTEGTLHLVQRAGPPLVVRIADLRQLVANAVAEAVAEVERAATIRLDAQVARAIQDLGLAPQWSPVAAYAAGDVVSCYVGRTYRLGGAVKASIGQEPGEHPGAWERIGSHGLRVHKSKPAHLQAGDVFTEADARFIFDGVATTLLSPKGVKHSEVERAVKVVHTQVQQLAEQHQMTRRDVEGLQQVSRANTEAANENTAWIRNEGDQAVLRSATSEAWIDHRKLLIDSPALARLVDHIDDILPNEGAA